MKTIRHLMVAAALLLISFATEAQTAKATHNTVKALGKTANSIQQTSDVGFSDARTASFADKRVTGSHGSSDVWLLKLLPACTPTSSSSNSTACDSLVWNGKTYKTSGSYNDTLTNAAGCDSIATLNLTVNYSTTSDTTATVCNRFTWHGTTYTASGNYIYDTTTTAGCDSSTTLHLTLTSLTTSSSKTDAGCFGSATGSLTVTPTSGVSPYTYRIGTSTPYVTSGTFSNLKAGTYTVSVIDAAGCSGTTSPITIGQSSPISAAATPTAALCYNTYTGAITINPSTPGSYTYSIGTTGVYQSSNTFSNLRAGTYRVTIQDAGGCKTTLSNIVVGQPTPVKIVVNSVNNPNNATQDNGSITVSGTGGAVGGYLFKFGTTGTYQSSGMFTNLKAGTYRIFIKDANDCAGASYAVTLTYTPARPGGKALVNGRIPSAKTNIMEGVSISPNPTTSTFKVSVKGTQNEAVHLRVMDVNGKVIYTAQGRSNQSFTFGEAFMIGMYMVEVRQGNEVKVLKAIKMK